MLHRQLQSVFPVSRQPDPVRGCAPAGHRGRPGHELRGAVYGHDRNDVVRELNIRDSQELQYPRAGYRG